MTVAAVVVCYHPDLEELKRNIDRVRPQVDFLVLVDNSEPSVDLSSLGADQIIALGVNKGIGWAHNIGIEASIELGVDRVLLLDQDSLLAPGAVPKLSEVLDKYPKCAAVGPLYKELNSGQISKFVQINPFRDATLRNKLTESPYCVRTDTLIASGMMIRIEAFGVIGGMREEFFIDYVDTEWCLRARKCGYQVLGLKQVLLTHRIGSHFVKIWIGRWRYIAVHEPNRYYYSFRNGVKLVFDSDLGIGERMYVGFRTCLFLMVLALTPRIYSGSLKQACRGLEDVWLTR